MVVMFMLAPNQMKNSEPGWPWRSASGMKSMLRFFDLHGDHS